MKKYFLLAMLSALSVSSFANKCKTGTKFGEPSNGCKGSSICYIATTSTPSVDFVPVDWELNGDGTLLTMTVSEDVVDQLPEDVYNGFMHGYFDMRETFAFPASVTTAVRGSSDIVLPTGHYAVVHSGAMYTVTFHL